MNMDWDEILESARDQMRGWYDAFSDESQTGGIVSMLKPVDPYNRSAILTPIVAAAGALGLIVFAGAAVAAMAVAVAAMVAVCYLLTEVFGYDVSLAGMPPASA
jgi:hypothetical protein